MRLRIKEVNFEMDKNWVFHLTDGSSDYYVLNENMYKKIGIKSPLSKHHLDQWDVGHSILCDVVEIKGVKIVTKVK
ncbi:hypothetical protein KIH41_17405 [Litoribacter ruber]|uniref:hypothetical protein n=1 Tax=Litoribacter TaxID=1237104 RepID=UPI00117ED676|nr:MULTISPECIES: hypothetical protein [Litoribacter]MBT0813069.1 hypothetical protein [Litoribacter ruber]